MATGLSLSSTSNLSSGQKIFVAAARLAFEAAAPDPDLVQMERIPDGVKQWDIMTMARLSQASALTEGVDLSQTEQLVASSVSITPSEHGIIATLSKRLIRRQGDQSIVATAGRQLAESLRRRQANDVIALYDGFSKSIVGAGNTLDITHFRGAVAYLRTDNDSSYGPAPMPLHAALHAEHISDIIADLSDPGAVASSRFGLSAEVLQGWWRGSDRVYGVEVFESGNISRDSSDDAKGAIFARSALAMVMATNAEATEEDDPSARVTEYGMFQEWSEAEIADAHGVEVYGDAASTV